MSPQKKPSRGPYIVDGAQYTHEQALRVIWKHTHRDYRSTPEDGVRCILILEHGATVSSPLLALSDHQINEKLPYAARKEINSKKYPVGTRVVNLHDERDVDHQSRERTTPVGNVWEVRQTGNEKRHIVCRATGAYIIPTVKELDEQFKILTGQEPVLTADQIRKALQILQVRPAVIPGTRAILDDESRKRWFDQVCAAMTQCGIEGPFQTQWFCDIAGVAE